MFHVDPNSATILQIMQIMAFLQFKVGPKHLKIMILLFLITFTKFLRISDQ